MKLFLMSMLPHNLLLILKKKKQVSDFYELRKQFFASYDFINKKDISKFITEHWRILNKEYEEYLRAKNIPLNFLRDKVIGYTMFVSSGGDVMKAELDFLESIYEKDDLSKYLAEEAVGLPILMNSRYATSHNSIHHLYHISRFLFKTGADLDSLKTVIEWGGGYGNLAKIFLRLRDKAQDITYVIIDTPLFSCIQWLYLSAVLGRGRVHMIKEGKDAIICGMINIVPLGFVEKVTIKPDLFISTWALSESSVFAQDYVCDRNFFGAGHILIAYQKSNRLLPDAERVHAIIGKKREGMINEPIGFLQGNSYLFK